MAKTNIYYSFEGEGGNEDLCFMCAVRKTMTSVNSDEEIHIETNDYQFGCDCCGKSIEDSITI